MTRSRNRRAGSLPEVKRKLKKTKPLIFVFCEGQSEQAYMEYIRKAFKDAAVIKKPIKMDGFEDALAQLNKNPVLNDVLSETDEIWFFFDVEADKADTWPTVKKIIESIRKKRKKPAISVRLLMTTGCVEYWFLLHYEQSAPPISTPETKEAVLRKLKNYEPHYKKGDESVTARIAENYATAVQNGIWSLHCLAGEGLPCEEATDERDAWLFRGVKTFTTVQEAIIYLQSLPKQ